MTDDPRVPEQLDPSAAWVDLLGPVDGAKIALFDEGGGRSADVLRAAGAQVSIVGPQELAGLPSQSCDAVVLVDVGPLARTARSAAAVLRDGGVLLVVLTNSTSPLTWVDCLRQRRRPSAGSRRRARRVLGSVGLPPVQEYGLLRSVESPSTYFSLHHPGHAALVLSASNTLNGGGRRRMVAALARAARAGLAAPLVPAIALLCSARPLAFEPVLGRIGYLGSHEAKLLVGDPLREIVKVYGSATVAAAEGDALEQVGRAWPGLAPHLLERLGDRRNRITWTPGRTLAVAALDDLSAQRWMVLAAETLGGLHRRLGPAEDGTVLVHGDYWLGNLLVDVDGRDIVGVIDWTDTGRGVAERDLHFLVDSWAAVRGLPEGEVDRLRTLVGQAYATARGA